MAFFFFYGTLMHPDILRRVINHTGTSLKICPAVLPEYTRHRVKFASYPGILPYSQSRDMFDHDLDSEERSVRGTLVNGLTNADIEHLDVFEGNEYIREVVDVWPLGPFTSLSESLVLDDIALPSRTPLPDPIQAQTYVYKAPISDLKAELWSFSDFVANHAWEWIGSSAEDE